jgi:hypothetical protein
MHRRVGAVRPPLTTLMLKAAGLCVAIALVGIAGCPKGVSVDHSSGWTSASSGGHAVRDSGASPAEGNGVTASAPPARAMAALSYLPQLSGLVLFGGLSASQPFGDTWLFANQSWTSLSPARSPPDMFGMSASFDAASDSIVLFGGFSAACLPSEFCNTTWIFTGSEWNHTSPAASPPARFDASMAFDSTDHLLVLFGGWDGRNYLRDTWTYASGTWTNVTGSTGPSPRESASMAQDPHGGVVLFGGAGCSPPNATNCSPQSVVTYADTWHFGGGKWTPLSGLSPSPAARFGATLICNPLTGSDLLFGGASASPRGAPFADTWTFNGSGWSSGGSDGGPPARLLASSDFDPSDGSVVLFGGEGVPDYLNDTWHWTGGGWVELNQPGSPQKPDASATYVAVGATAVATLVIGVGWWRLRRPRRPSEAKSP